MKKFTLIFIALLFLTACGNTQANKKNGDKEYTSDEFSIIYWDISEFKSNEFNSMTNDERFGKTDSEEERQKNAKEVNIRLQSEAMKKYGIEFGDRIRIRGKIRSSGVDSDKFLTFYLDSMQGGEDYLPFLIVMSNKDIETPKDGTLVVIEGEFTEKRAVGPAMFDECEIISQ